MEDVWEAPTPPDSPTILKGATFKERLLDFEEFAQLLNQQIAVVVDDTSGQLISPLQTITLEGFSLRVPNTNTPGIASEDAPGEITLLKPMGVVDNRLTVAFTDTGAGVRVYTAGVEILVNGVPSGGFTGRVSGQGSGNDFTITIFNDGDLAGLPVDLTVLRLRLTYTSGSGDRTISLVDGDQSQGRTRNVRPREAT